MRSALLASFIGCGGGPDPTTVEGAFERMAEAAEGGSARDLFAALDDESRGSVSAIRQVQREARAIVDRDYPPAERAKAAGRWRLGAQASDAAGVFAAWCGGSRCLGEVRDRLSAIDRTRIEGDRAVVRVRRGREYPFARSPAGRWGLALFGERLRRWKIEAYRDLDAIRAAGRIFREGP